MTHDEKEIDRLRGVLRERLRRAPDRINAASVQVVRDYKKAYVAAAKLVDKRAATAGELQAAITQVS